WNQNGDRLLIASSGLHAYGLDLAGREAWHLRDGSCELRQISRRRSQGVLEVECHLCAHQRLAVEVVQGADAPRTEDTRLHEVLQIFWRDAEDGAGLLELQLSIRHGVITVYYRLHFRR